MQTRILLLLPVIVCLPALAQTGLDEAIANAPPQSQSDMLVPPPVSDAPYARTVGSEERSNVLRIGLTASGGYVSNLSPGSAGSNFSGATYLLQPVIEFNRTGTRLHSTISYSPSFAWYQLPNVVNTTDHGLTANAQIRLSPHVNLLANETFRKMSTGFGQNTANFEQVVGGGSQFVSPGIYGLFEPQESNQSIAVLTWQFTRDDMIAGSGSIGTLRFSNPAESGGLYNSTQPGGSASWTHRVGVRQYLGGLYQYSFVQERPPVAAGAAGSVDTQTDGLFSFYTLYLTPHSSVSVQGGDQHVTITDLQMHSSFGNWSPGGRVSLGWQGEHTAVALSYNRLVTAGQGLRSGYLTNGVAGSGEWQMARSWSAELYGGYSTLSNAVAAPLPDASAGYGHTITGGVTLGHRITQSVQLSGKYDRIHQSYGNLPSISAHPDSDRVLFSVTYLLSRPLGQ